MVTDLGRKNLKWCLQCTALSQKRAQVIYRLFLRHHVDWKLNFFINSFVQRELDFYPLEEQLVLLYTGAISSLETSCVCHKFEL